MTGKHSAQATKRGRGGAEPCPRCGASRWRTLERGRIWRCRRCSYIRDLGESTTREEESRATS